MEEKRRKEWYWGGVLKHFQYISKGALLRDFSTQKWACLHNSNIGKLVHHYLAEISVSEKETLSAEGQENNNAVNLSYAKRCCLVLAVGY